MANAPKTCEEVLALLYPYIDGEIAGTLCSEVQAHLELCGDCTKHFDFERDLKELVRAKCAGEPVPEGLAERMRVRLRDALGKN